MLASALVTIMNHSLDVKAQCRQSCDEPLNSEIVVLLSIALYSRTSLSSLRQLFTFNRAPSMLAI